MKTIIISVLLVVGIVVAAVMLGGDSEIASGETSNNFYGAEEGIVTLTEYGDFQCPACAGFFPVVTQVKEQLKDQLRFEFKHFPLVQIHQNATAAHRAAQAAANQGKFWEMHDLLYQRQQSWSQVTSPASIFEDYAREIGLDMDQYSSEVSSSTVLGVINADIALAKEKNVASTPTFFLDGKQIEDLNAISTAEGFAQLIQDAIDEKQGSGNESSAEPTPTEETAKPEEDEVN
jgi:protein-disulfide isomerase